MKGEGHMHHLASLVINCVAPLPQVIRLFDVREDAATNAHHPQKLVDVITRVPMPMCSFVI